DSICKRYHVDLVTTLTGFKWIGKAILQNKKKFMFGAEESYGFLVSDYVRDKDSISATLMTCEIACVLKDILSINLIDMLKMMYDYYGVHKSHNVSIDYQGVEGTIEMQRVMKNLRDNPIKMVTDIKVTKVDDYKISKTYDYRTNKEEKLDYPPNDTLKYYLDDNSIITIRPSEKKKKIKIYYDIIDSTMELAENKVNILNQSINKILKKGE
ncbi:MAG: phospho-sugar mutase, partial [Lachnospiraceae bacterium]|nr:phospho-sugar mutase [Lachnospiraceae bacterium]